MGKYKKTIKTIIKALNNGATMSKHVDGDITACSDGILTNVLFDYTQKEDIEKTCKTCRFSSDNNGLGKICIDHPEEPVCDGTFPAWEPVPKGTK